MALTSAPGAPSFDSIARPYRWLEYLSLGPLLQLTRTHHLAHLAASRHALILGDGDGRFTSSLLTAHGTLRVDAVDLSRGMLHLLRRRCLPFASRLIIHQADARTYTPTFVPDLLITHFFLDCLTQSELDALIARLTPLLSPQALWLVSDFRIPGGLLHWPARLYIRALYAAFRLLTGLRITHLPDHATPFRRFGYTPIATHRFLFGILTTELWQRSDRSRVHP